MSDAVSQADQFDAMYRGEFRLPDGTLLVPPWEIDEPQPIVVELVAKGSITGRVLDAGCGTGHNAVHLADAGLQVVGFDVAPTAVAAARERADVRGSSVRFVCADATDLPSTDELGGPFDTVLDVGMFHALTEEQRTRYCAGLHRLVRVDGSVIVVALTEWVQADAIRSAFSDGWQVTEVRETETRVILPAGAARANWGGAQDDQGRFSRLPAHLAVAVRK